ncbi:MAG TPA: hypothetical protein DCP28_36795, partial [Cytophagales bacterium]|nr:hypothetical protein [Cytophagales bacterium]
MPLVFEEVMGWLETDSIAQAENIVVSWRKESEWRHDPIAIAQAYFTSGRILQHLSEWEEAENWYEKGLLALLPIDSATYLKGILLLDLGYMQALQGQWLEAQPNFFNSLTIWKERKDSVQMAKSLSNLGQVFSQLGQYDSAVAYLTESGLIGENLRDSLRLFSTANNLGDVYAKQKQWRKAVENYEKAQSIRSAMVSRRMDINSKRSLAEAYAEVGRNSEGLILLEECKRKAEEEGLPDLLVLIQSSFGYIYYLGGDYNSAFLAFRAVWEEPDNVNAFNLMNAYLNGGASLFFLDRYAEAETAYLKALSLAKEIGAQQEESYAYYNLAELYDAMGQTDRVFKYMLAYDELNSTLLNERRTQQVAEMQEK